MIRYEKSAQQLQVAERYPETNTIIVEAAKIIKERYHLEPGEREVDSNFQQHVAAAEDGRIKQTEHDEWSSYNENTGYGDLKDSVTILSIPEYNYRKSWL